MVNNTMCDNMNISDQSDEHISVKSITHGIYVELKVNKKDILYFEATKNRRTILKTLDDDYELLVKPLTYYKKLVNSDEFAIVVRNYLVNLKHVVAIDGEYFVLKNNDRVLIGTDGRTKKLSKEKYVKYLSNNK